MKWVFTYIKPLRTRILKGITVKIVGTLAELFIPFLLSYILENVIETNNAVKILAFGGLMVACAVVACLGNIIANTRCISEGDLKTKAREVAGVKIITHA